MLQPLGLNAYTPPPGSREQKEPAEDVAIPLPAPQDETEDSSLVGLRRTAALGFLAFASLVPALSLAQEKPVEEVDARAVSKTDTAATLDNGLSPAHARGWRSFGHETRGGAWFDRAGNWADTHTAVTADQFAAMPAAQQKAFATRVGVKLEEIRGGDAERVMIHPAVGRAVPGELVDTQRSYGEEPDGTRRFGHRPVAGQLFNQGRWKDTGTLVSSDQAAAMAPEQRALLGEDVRLGNPARAVVELDTSKDDPKMVELLQKKPGLLVRFQGHRMKPATALAYARLEKKLAEHFPGREVRITSTTAGRHTDPAHKNGLAMDFVVENLTREESKLVEELSWQSGFKPFNEYVRTSKYKTGDHMHVVVIERR
ncbi:hypothetical protein DYH09_10445 [bacterium CPR1]|nr:hypothetical protein [bacterium CPR1]